jgi:acetylornithine/succinyldiaminopimelate/putrescine aminotransferase
MTGGFPIAACVGRAKVMDSWPESKGEAIHTSTFLGNPLGCAASLAAIAELKRLKLDARSRDVGEWFSKRLARIDKVRGKGLMLGLEVDDAPRLCKRLLRRGILALPEGNRSEVLGLTPPLVITKRQLEYSMKVLKELLR